jgi:hypothetical protein
LTLVTVAVTVDDAITPSPLGADVGVWVSATDERLDAHTMQAAANDEMELFKLDLLDYDDECRARSTPPAAMAFSQMHGDPRSRRV